MNHVELLHPIQLIFYQITLPRAEITIPFLHQLPSELPKYVSHGTIPIELLVFEHLFVLYFFSTEVEDTKKRVSYSTLFILEPQLGHATCLCSVPHVIQ